jgi:hypothetical protein
LGDDEGEQAEPHRPTIDKTRAKARAVTFIMTSRAMAQGTKG